MTQANELQIAIVGAGTMGASIAQVVALGGCRVILHDIDRAILRYALGEISRGLDRGVRLGKVEPHRARRARRAFTVTSDLARCAPADIAIEAVFEDAELKLTVIKELASVLRAEAVLATSSSTLPLERIAAAIPHPERLIGLHFYKPAHIMQLVEIARAAQTGTNALEQATALVRAIGKTPVIVDDSPGRLVNRIGQAYWGEALRLLDERPLDVETIDRLMEGIGFPMGPFRLVDFLGGDTAYTISTTLWEASFHHPRYRPHLRQQQMVEAGLTGRKGQRGFYPPP